MEAPSDNGITPIYLRLNEVSPKIIGARLQITSINSRSLLKDIALEYMELLIENSISEKDNAYFYKDAEPILNPYYEEELASRISDIEKLENLLKDESLTIDKRQDYEEKLEIAKKAIEEIQKRKYLVSPEELERYKQMADGIFIYPAGPFSPGTDAGNNLNSLVEQFANGLLSPEEFLQKADNMARLVELEGQ